MVIFWLIIFAIVYKRFIVHLLMVLLGMEPTVFATQAILQRESTASAVASSPTLPATSAISNPIPSTSTDHASAKQATISSTENAFNSVNLHLLQPLANLELSFQMEYVFLAREGA